ncbi:MAG: MAPEG family protein [Hyphomicrobiaceae bacterium]|nr:MAPEG family protein [Hyphomicrobiaceae bacterium]
MHYPVITAIAAGIIINLQMILMAITGKSRYKHLQGLGIGDDQPELLARVRSHGNLAENAAIVLFVLALLEMAGTNQTLIIIAATAFVIGRLLHPIGLFKTSGSSIPRALGVAATALVGTIGGLALIYTAIGMM